MTPSPGDGLLRAVEQSALAAAMTAYALLAANAHPTEAEICAALDGNICRCGTHARILRAIKKAAAALP